MPAIQFAIVVAAASFPAHTGGVQEASRTEEMVATAVIEEESYRSPVPIWVHIEVTNRTGESWSVLRDVNTYDYIRTEFTQEGEPVKETAYREYARSLRYVTDELDDSFFEDDIEGDDLRSAPQSSRAAVVEPGGEYSVRMLANLAHDMTAPGNYTMRFGVPYFSIDEGSVFPRRAGIAWTEAVVVEVVGPLEPPGDQ